MTSATHRPRTPTWRSWLLLVAAAALLCVANGRWQLPVAAWLSPLLLLLFLRSHRSLTGLVLGYLVQLAAFFVNWWEIIPLPGVWYFLAAGVYATVYFLPFVLDRWLAADDPRLRSTLVLPMSWVTIELLVAKFTPYGTWSALGYTQVDHAHLLQVASVVGLAGISFLILWFSAVCAWLWQHRHHDARRLGHAAVCFLLLLGILMAGDARKWSGNDTRTVRVASLTPSAELTRQLQTEVSLLDEAAGAEELERLQAVAGRVNSDLLTRSRIEALAGAEVIVWAEHAARVTNESEPDLIRSAQRIAREHSVLLVLGVGVRHPHQRPGFENKAIVITPDGLRAPDYRKARPIVGQESSILEKGNQAIAIVDQGDVRFAVAICHDLDFADLLLQTGRQQVDVLLVPSADWEAITPLHARMAVVRAVENGCSLVRPCSDGLSLAVDPLGRVLASQIDDDTAGTVMVSQVPVHRRTTLYARVGDSFAYANLIALAAVLAVSISRVIATRFHPGSET